MNMLPHLTWLTGTLLPLGALWLVYRVALRGERCVGYNRALLLLAPVVAALWPLLPHPAVPAWLSAPSVAAPGMGLSVLLPAVQVGQAALAVAEWSAWSWLWLLYLAGVALGLGRLTWRAARLRSLVRRLPHEVRPGYVLAYTSGQLPTSFFGSVVFWDETATLTPAEADAVLAHEVAHVQQRHTLDVLWLEVWRALLWPNPFAHLLLPGLRLTHELLADQAATAGLTQATPYPVLLARVAAQQLRRPAYFTLLQPFTLSFTLTRIAMLQSKTPARRWKQWLVLPVLGGLFLAACQSSPLKEMVPPPPPPPPPALATVPRSVLEAAAAGHIYTYVEQMPQLPGGGGSGAIIKQIQDNFIYPAGAQQEGRVFANFIVAADGSVSNVKIIKGLAPAYDAAVLAAINQLPRFVPGKQAGNPVAVSFTVPVTFKNKL